MKAADPLTILVAFMEKQELSLFLKPRVLKPAAETADQITRRFAMNKVGRMLAAAHQDRSIRLYDARNCEEIQRLQDGFLCTSLAFSPRGDLLATGGVDRLLKLWDIRTGEVIAKLEGHSYPLLSLAFSPDGSRLLSSSGDTTLMVWDVDNRSSIRQLKGHSLYVVSCDWDPSGNRVVSGGVDAVIGVWNPDTGEKIQWIKEHRTAVHSVRFSHDGKRAVSGSSDLTIMLWDTTEEKFRRENTLQKHTEEVRCLAFNHDNSLLSSGSSDKNLYVWGLKTLTVDGEGRTAAEIDGIEWFPDQNAFMTCDSTGAITRWDVVDYVSMIEPFQMLLKETESDTSGARREELVAKFESINSQYDPEVLRDKRVFYIMWQCKKALGLLKGKPREN